MLIIRKDGVWMRKENPLFQELIKNLIEENWEFRIDSEDENEQ